MRDWEEAPVPGETPIDPSGLKLRGITTRAQLAVAEAANISKAFLKYLTKKPSARTAPFDFDWLLKLHEEMYSEVWEWAGIIRDHDLTIGVPHYLIREYLMSLVGDLQAWIEFEHSVEEQAVRLHHKAVEIHPFENGNGRWARLLANIWLKQNGKPIVAWPDAVIGTQSTIRQEYLDAVRAADRGSYGALSELHARFTE